MWARPGETWEALPALEKQRAVDAAAEDVVLEDASRRDRRQQLLAASDSHRGMFAGQESDNRPATSLRTLKAKVLKAKVLKAKAQLMAPVQRGRAVDDILSDSLATAEAEAAEADAAASSSPEPEVQP